MTDTAQACRNCQYLHGPDANVHYWCNHPNALCRGWIGLTDYCHLYQRRKGLPHMDTQLDTAQRMAEALRVKLMRNMEMRRGFSRDEVDLEDVQEWNAEWDEMIKAHDADTRRAVLEEAVKVANENKHNGISRVLYALDRLREGV